MLATLLALTLALPVATPLDEGVVETFWPGGGLRERYEVDETGVKHGEFTQYREDGSTAVTARYRDGELQGRYAELDEEGELLLEGMYEGGERSGYWRTYEDGVRTLSATYRKGVLDGRWESEEPDRSHKIKATYRRGVLDGRYTESRPEERWERSATYKKGLLDGAAKIKVGNKVVSRRKWERGFLAQLDGRVPYPRSLPALTEELGLARVVASGDREDPISADRQYALMRLKTYRALCGLPWRTITLDEKWNDLCDAASEVCQANGELDHTPEQPDGFDDDRYRQGYEGASHSNLANGGLARSVDMYMDDSDPSNIDRVGHRRWCLNPSMGKTGFGAAGSWAAMWSMDGSGPSAKGVEAVLYPPPGYVPLDLFGPRHAWSIQLVKGKTPASKEDIEVEVVRLDEVHQPRGEPLELDWKDINRGGYGGGPCVIFRPVDLQCRAGVRYGVKVSFDGGKSLAFDYLVEFVEAPQGD